jgi:hypothetical protein
MWHGSGPPVDRYAVGPYAVPHLQGSSMTHSGTPTPPSTGGGAIIALLALVGVFAGGYFFNQPTIGLLAGFGTGVAIALLLWWRETRR